jgi:hypothetical protein
MAGSDTRWNRAMHNARALNNSRQICGGSARDLRW